MCVLGFVQPTVSTGSVPRGADLPATAAPLAAPPGSLPTPGDTVTSVLLSKGRAIHLAVLGVRGDAG